jgi:peptidoglycan/LPS O-acetylase OafA/YrhL/lysophospholipase L1-like esterase
MLTADPDPFVTHRPGLDGLRGLAVAAVVAYHLGYGWAGGGFLGVSLFFTLSGYLVTSVLLADHAATGRVQLGRFWARRARRILPASLLLLAGVSLVAGLLGSAPGLAGDVRAALGQVANWRFVVAHRSYVDRFAAPSPLRHLWSLAIEEQLYVVLPLVAWAALRRSRRTLAFVLGVLCAASVVVQLALRGAPFDRVYQGTDTRAAELLVGALAACVMGPARLARCRSGARACVGAVAACAALALLWGTTRVDDAWLRFGGFGTLALVHLAVVLVAAGPLGARLFGARPLAALGRVSYGVYLYHWPIVVWLTPARTGWSRPVVDGVRITLALGLAFVSRRFVEAPVRAGVLPRRVSLRVGGYAFTGVLVATVLVPSAQPAGASAALARYRAVALPVVVPIAPLVGPTTVAPSTAGPPTPASTTASITASTTAEPALLITEPVLPAVSLPPVVRPLVWLVGDSVPYSLAPALSDVLAARGADLLNLAVPACDGARGNPTSRLGIGVEDTEVRPDCLAWEERWPAFAAARQPDVVLFVLGGTTTLDRRVDGGWHTPCQAVFRSWYQPEVLARVDWVLAHTAATPVMTTSPWAEDRVIGVVQGDHRARTDCVNEVYRDVAAQRAPVRLVDLQTFVCPAGEASPCQPWRSDGLHFDGTGAVEVATWLADRALVRSP